jgi:hypothetical protein
MIYVFGRTYTVLRSIGAMRIRKRIKDKSLVQTPDGLPVEHTYY